MVTKLIERVRDIMGDVSDAQDATPVGLTEGEIAIARSLGLTPEEVNDIRFAPPWPGAPPGDIDWDTVVNVARTRESLEPDQQGQENRTISTIVAGLYEDGQEEEALRLARKFGLAAAPDPDAELKRMAVQAIRDEDWARASAIDDYRRRPTSLERFQTARSMITDPADLLTLSALAGGFEIPGLEQMQRIPFSEQALASQQFAQEAIQPQPTQPQQQPQFPQAAPTPTVVTLPGQVEAGTGRRAQETRDPRRIEAGTGRLSIPQPGVQQRPQQAQTPVQGQQGAQQQGVQVPTSNIQLGGVDIPVSERIGSVFQGQSPGDPSSLLAAKGLPLPSAQAQQQMTAGEAAFFLQAAQLSGIPLETVQRELQSVVPAPSRRRRPGAVRSRIS